MAKRLSVGRIKNLFWSTKYSLPASKEWPPSQWGEPCLKTTSTVLNNEEVLGAITPPATSQDPGGISNNTPLTYLGTNGGANNFLLGDSENGTETNVFLPCAGATKVLVYTLADAPTTQAFISASVPGDNRYIIMEVGARVELTWTPQGTNAYGSWAGFWGSSLMHSGCYDDCGVPPKAYLTESLV